MVVENIGSTAIYYEWRKVKRGDYIEAKASDGVQRFYCHYPRHRLLPGQKKIFTFSFRSVDAGMFYEEWEMLTEPSLLKPLQVLSLSGTAIEEDSDVEELAALDAELEGEAVQHTAAEVLEDMVDDVRTSTPPLPDMRDPDVF